MPHPFANTQLLSRPLSGLSVVSSFLQVVTGVDSNLTAPGETNVSDKPETLPRLHPARSTRFLQTSNALPTLPSEQPAQFVARNSSVTLLLDEQDPSVSMPFYCCGTSISGVITIEKVSSILGLEVKIQGVVNLHEYGEDNFVKTDVLDTTIISWDTEEDGPFPSQMSFRYSIPEYYLVNDTGERYLLPPSYQEHYLLPPSYRTQQQLPSCLPGFDAEVSYRILIKTFRVRDKVSFWKNHSILKVPFLLHHNTRPAVSGPFPLNATAHSSRPQTLLMFRITTQEHQCSDVDVNVFLPLSRIFTVQDPIPFTITLSGSDAALAPFRLHQVGLSSFLPLTQTSRMHGRASAVEAQLRGAEYGAPRVCLQLQRTTVVDTRQSPIHPGTEKTHVHYTRVIGTGVMHRSAEGLNSVAWSGTILVEPGLTCGGFETGNLRVEDSIMLSISMCDTSGRMKTFCKATPVRLAMRRYDCTSAAPLKLAN